MEIDALDKRGDLIFLDEGLRAVCAAMAVDLGRARVCRNGRCAHRVRF